MSKLETTLQNLPTVAKYALVLLVIISISYLFPNNARFKYDFENGQTWRHDDLMAPFDFAIKKSAQELEAEKILVAKDFSPYYKMDLDIAHQKKEAFTFAFNVQLEEVKPTREFKDVPSQPRKYLNFSHKFIDQVYEKGVVELASQHAEKEKDFVVILVKGNTKENQTIQNLTTPQKIEKDISEYLFQSGLREAEFLIPLLKNFFTPNIFYSDSLTNHFQNEQLNQIAQSRGMIKKGELIIAHDAVVTDTIFQQLISFKEKFELEVSDKKYGLGVFSGYFLLTSLIIGVFLLYLQFHARHIFNKYSHLVFMMLWLLAYSYLVFAIESTNSLSAYLVPFCIAPIVLKSFFNERIAMFTHIVIVLLASFLSSLGYEFTFLQMLAGIVAVLTPTDTRDFSKFFFALSNIFLAYALGFLGLSLIKEGTFASMDWSVYGWFFGNVFLTLLANPMIPLLERLFGFTSSFRLVELSDMNRPLLKELSVKAPGTLQHSLQVANLAEVAATKINANALLVKVGALYHDIGKLKQPQFFIENQTGNNPHDEIDDLKSAQLIIEHVTEGVKMAKKKGLPQVLIDFICTHHGTTRVEYFFRNYTNKHPEREVDENQFRYPGPRPTTKEATILMLADSLEAAAKSLKNPTEEDISNLVEKIVEGKLEQRQLEQSELTFHELEICKKEFKKLLKSIHHVRIEYPE